MAAFNHETVLEVEHFTDSLFFFRTTRDQAFRFDSGHFAMIGLEVEGKPLLRAYSMASATWEETLGFYSIKVEDGPLTSRLRDIKPGDQILVGRKPTGTLLLHNLLPGKVLFMLSTGTGLAPFVSLAKDPELYERFDRVILAHGCRTVAELAYGARMVEELKADEITGEFAGKLEYHPMVTREPFRNPGRVTDLIEQGALGDFDPETTRAMICGSPAMLADCKRLLEERDFVEGSSNTPGSFVIEKAFAEQ